MTGRLRKKEELISDAILRGEVAENLIGIRDIERTMTKIVYGSCSAKELRSVAETAQKFPQIKSLLADVKCKKLKEIYSSIDSLEDISFVPETIKITINKSKFISNCQLVHVFIHFWQYGIITIYKTKKFSRRLCYTIIPCFTRTFIFLS